MTATAHALIGTLIAAKIQDPMLAAPLALASHFVADIIPHWDTATHRKRKEQSLFFAESLVDVVLGFFLSFLLIVFLFPTTNLFYAFIIIIIAQSPDWLMAPYVFFKNKFPLFRYAYKLQHSCNKRLDKPWGIVTQVVVVFLLVLFATIL